MGRFASFGKGICALLLPAVLLIFYQNFSSSAAIVRTPVSFEFGPPPQAVDFHTQFQPNLANFKKFVELRRRTDRFHIHQVAYYSHYNSGVAIAHNTRWTAAEARNAAAILNTLEFKVSTTSSGGLSKYAVCHAQLPSLRDSDAILSEEQKRVARNAARAAADFEIASMRILRNSNLQISRIYLDGPFLMILKNSKKLQSCGAKGHGIGNLHLAAYIVDEYLARLAEVYPNAELVHLINIVNWTQVAPGGDLLLPAWGSDKNLLSGVLDVFLPLYKTSASAKRYRLAGISLDAPWSVINGGNGLGKFGKRLDALRADLVRHLGADIFKGPFFLHLIVNTEPGGHLDSRLPFLRHFENQRNKYSRILPLGEVCATRVSSPNLESACLAADQTYYSESSAFADFIFAERNKLGSTLSEISNLEIQFGSWHDFPRTSVHGPTSYADFVISSVNRLQPAQVVSQFELKPRLAVIERAVLYQSCSAAFRAVVAATYAHPTLRHLLCSRGYPGQAGQCREGEYLAMRPDVAKVVSYRANPMSHWSAFGRGKNLCEPSLR